MAQWLVGRISDQGVPGSNPGRCTFRCGLEQVTSTLLSTGLTQEAVDGRPTWTDCDEAGDYVVPNVLSPRDLVFRPDNMDETVPHTGTRINLFAMTLVRPNMWSPSGKTDRPQFRLKKFVKKGCSCMNYFTSSENYF